MAYDYVYENYLRHIRTRGVFKGDRTGTGTLSVFGYQMRFNLREGFPLITTKKVHMKSIVHELLWFLQGSTNIKYLQEHGVKIWDEWADENGDLGPVYGSQWRSWPGKLITQRDFDPAPTNAVKVLEDHDGAYVTYQEGIDQIANVVARIKAKPDDRRLIVSAWNPAEIDKMKLPPCHALFQFWTRELSTNERAQWAEDVKGVTVFGDIRDPEKADRTLDNFGIPRRAISCQLYQRSCDSFLGVPFNIASYALLTEMIAQQCNMVAEEFIWTGGDCHIYSNHYEQVDEQLSRTGFDYPKLKFNRKPESIFDYKFEDIEIVGYESQSAIKAPVAV